MSAYPEFVVAGEEALRRAAVLMAQPTEMTFPSGLGAVTLKSGTVQFSKRLVVMVTSYTIAYMEGDRLYVMPPSLFIRDEYFLAMSKGAQRAAYWIPIAHAEMALLTGIFVPWYLLL